MKKYYNFLSKRLLSIFIIYVTLFTIIAYSTSIMYNKTIYSKNEQKRAEQITDNLKNFLTYSIDLTQALSTNESVIAYAQDNTLDLYNNHSNKRSIAFQLSALAYKNSYPFSIAVVQPAQNKIITASGLEFLDGFINNNGIKCENLEKTLLGLQSVNKDNYALDISINENAKSYLIACTSYKTNYGKPIVFLTLYDFDTLFSSIPESDLDCLINVRIDKASISFAFDESLNKAIKMPEIDTLEYKKVASASINSYYWRDVSCVFYAPFFLYFYKLNSFFFLLILLIIALVFIGLIVTKKNAEKIYHPVQELLTSFSINNTNNEAGEFAALKSHFASLTSQKNIMSDIISNNKKQLSDKFLLQLINSTIPKVQLREGLTTYGFNDSSMPIQVFILSYRDFLDLMNVLSIDGLNEVRNSIHEYFNAAYKSSKFFKLLDIDQQAMVIIAQSDDFESFIQSLKKHILTIEMLFDIDLIVFAGNIVSAWDEISSSYTSALYLKNKYVLTTDQNIIVASDNKNNDKIIEYPPDLENKLINSILSGNINSAIENINIVVDTNMSEKFFTRAYYAYFTTMLYSTFVRIFAQIRKTEAQVFGDIKIYLELASCSNAESLKSTLIDFASKIITSISDTQKDKSDIISSHMLSYIHENYADDISLFTLADYLNLSHSYTSTFFKAQTGENFKEYLTNFRLQKAIEIMKETPNMKIHDVGLKVGLTPKTFTRTFIRKYGTPPSNYMNIPKE